MPANRDVIFQVFGEGTGVHYDQIVEVTTRGRDRVWKEALLARIEHPKRVLDLACGTGILTFMLRDRFPDARVVGVDINEEYLAVARQRAKERRDDKVQFVVSPAEEVALEGTFDVIMTCYLPKYADLSRLVPQLCTHLEEGGLMIMQDFVYPQDRAVAWAWEYRYAECKRWAEENLPSAVGMFEALPPVIRESNWLEELTALMQENGIPNVERQMFDRGSAAIVWGRKQERQKRQ